MFLFDQHAYGSTPFQNTGDDEADNEAGGEEIQGNGIAVGRFTDPGQQQRPGNTSHAPGSQDLAVDSAEFFRAEQIAEEGGHTGEAAAVAGNDDKDNQLEDEGTACFCKCVEGKDLDQEEDYINCTAPEIVGNSRPENASQTVDQTDDTDHGGGCHRCHFYYFLCHR